MPKRVALYLRVSTDEQTIENQRQALQAVAKRHGWEVGATFQDTGVSGAKGRDQRPGYDALLKGVARREFDMVAAWSVCRLGRSLKDLIGFLSELRSKGVDLYLDQSALDTSTDMGRAMFQMLGVFSEFERSMIVARVKAGMKRAKDQPRSAERLARFKAGKIRQLKLGRPSNMTAAKKRTALDMLSKNVGVGKIGRTLGIGTGTVQKLKREMQAA